MIDPRRSVPILAMLILALAACGGSGTSGATAASSAAAEPAASAVAPDASAGDAGGAPSVEASAAPPEPASQPAAGGGGAGGDVCSLVTVDELADLFDVASVTTTVFAGPPDNCIVDSDAGDGLAAWSLTPVQADDRLRPRPLDRVSGVATAPPSSRTPAGAGSNLLVISMSAGRSSRRRPPSRSSHAAVG
jgi:hypothetical protein